MPPRPSPSRSLLLTLDAFDTLFTPRPSVPEQYATAAYTFGIPRTSLTPETLKTAFKTEFKRQLRTHPNYGRDAVLRGQYGGPRQWWEELIRASFARAMTTPPPPTTPLPDGLVAHLLERFASKQGYALYDDVGPFLGRMRRVKMGGEPLGPFDRVLVGVVSNSDDRVPAVLESLGVRVGGMRADEGVSSMQLPGFEQRKGSSTMTNQADAVRDIDLVITSYEAGEEKPSSHIFEVARRQAIRLAVQEGLVESDDAGSWTCVHVGDDYDKDYRAAIDAGWSGYFLSRDADSQRSADASTIRSLADLISRLSAYK